MFPSYNANLLLSGGQLQHTNLPGYNATLVIKPISSSIIHHVHVDMET